MDAGLIAVALVALYILPSIIAFCREHDSTNPIIVLNLLIGWTLLGWLLALAWACTETIPRPTPGNATTSAPRSCAPPITSAIAVLFVVVGAVAVFGVVSHQLGSRLFATSPSTEPSNWCRQELQKPKVKRAERASELCSNLAARR